MNHRISIDLANIPPTPTWKVSKNLTPWDAPNPFLGSWVPPIHWPRPRGCRWTSSLGIIFISWLTASWHWRSKHRHFWRSEWDRNGFYPKKIWCCTKICWRFDEILPSQIGFVPKWFQKWCSWTCFERRTYRKSPIWGEDIAVDVPGNHSNDWHVLMGLRPVTHI